MTHELIKLDYEYDALEPYMDSKTLEIHYSKHHQTYVDNFNLAIQGYPELENQKIEWILMNLESIPEEIKQAVINHGGGVYNHNFFFSILKKGTIPKKEILKEIQKKFGNFENFKIQFSEKALKLFGSGWTWLVLNKNELEIVQTFNQESVISKGMIPLIALDVWEHSYYLKYQNRRKEYIENFWNIIDWDKVNNLFLVGKK